MSAIEVSHLAKHFGPVKAVDDISFSVQKGEIFGFLGPNGAGKSTTIHCLMDFIRPTNGKIRIGGLDCQADSTQVKTNVGYLSASLPLYKNRTGAEHIELITQLRGLKPNKDTAKLIERLQFDPSKKARSLSSGNKQKLGFILALIGQPEVLLLDEPTSALDPILQKEVYDLLKDYASSGKTIFLSSHNLPEVERICTRAAIIRAGKLMAVEDIESLHQRQMHIITAQLKKPFEADAFNKEQCQLIFQDDNRISLKVANNLDAVIHTLSSLGIIDLEVTRASLEETFLSFYASNQ